MKHQVINISATVCLIVSTMLWVSANRIYAQEPKGKLVIGQAHAIDNERETLSTFLTEDDLLALWSQAGWRMKHTVYIIQDNNVPGKEGQLPYWDPNKSNVVWIGKGKKPTSNLIPIYVWKIKGLSELAGGSDATVEFNDAGMKVFVNLISKYYMVLEGMPFGSKQVYFLSAEDIKKKKEELQIHQAVLAKPTIDGLVTEIFGPDIKPLSKGTVLKLMLWRPDWYPRYQPGI